MSAPRSFVDGLVSLDAVETRKRLQAALTEARSKTGGRGGDGVAEAIREVESGLLAAAHWAVGRIDAALAEARAVAAREETIEEAHAAVVAGLDRDDPLRPDVSARNLAISRGEAPPPGC
ncbi:hypothetical protein ASF60_18095 [Methylobacterium sp. Leaf113]|uniref:hypothetical protein n=1 Tax=Methylobacterium sp. Leaf113 TaxID=1736259 RepID=UPI0006F8E22A|nr:hypothetical protein [Methylobacterium sp. Leaf113]KQP91356.1 hypothetical protein ASF60_18095 [Methylobacterium sp. Leaf113]